MKKQTTNRGFVLFKFKDTHDNDCSLQKSSLATEDCVWLGIDNPKLTVFENKKRGKYIISDMPKTFSVNTRMHLTQNQAKELVEKLNVFIETGDLIKPSR